VRAASSRASCAPSEQLAGACSRPSSRRRTARRRAVSASWDTHGRSRCGRRRQRGAEYEPHRHPGDAPPRGAGARPSRPCDAGADGSCPIGCRASTARLRCRIASAKRPIAGPIHWSFADGTSAATPISDGRHNALLTHAYRPGSYQIELNATDSTGDVATWQLEARVHPYPDRVSDRTSMRRSPTEPQPATATAASSPGAGALRTARRPLPQEPPRAAPDARAHTTDTVQRPPPTNPHAGRPNRRQVRSRARPVAGPVRHLPPEPHERAKKLS